PLMRLSLISLPLVEVRIQSVDLVICDQFIRIVRATSFCQSICIRSSPTAAPPYSSFDSSLSYISPPLLNQSLRNLIFPIKLAKYLIFVHCGKWKRQNWRLTSSNQRETATSLQGIRKLEKYSNIGKISSIRIVTDNSVAVLNIQRGAAAVQLAKLTDRILYEAEALKIQISARHVPGIDNTIADSLSRL
ncbi:MAG: hypothetical protein EZS28_035216, partial [Streblomastix strix]